MHRDKRPEWCDRFEANDMVNYHSIAGGPVTSSGHRVLKVGRIPGLRTPVACISGMPGVISFDALSHLENKRPSYA